MTVLEGHAYALRQRAGVGATGPFDPFGALKPLGLVVLEPSHVAALTAEQVARIEALDAKTWSGGAQRLPDGRTLVMLNPNQTPERRNVTVLEEVAHVLLGHKPTRIFVGPSGLPEREYDAAVEQEAYWTAAAALLPALDVARAVWAGRPAAEVGAQFGASEELVAMRVKTLQLWAPYQKNLALEDSTP